MPHSFDAKWKDIYETKEMADEKLLFVDVVQKPITQRQLNLYYYFRFIEEKLKNVNAKKVIEVGCGRGTIALYLSKYMGLETHLLDDQKDAIALAEDSFKQFNQKGTFFVKDVLKTGLPDNSYDGIVSIGLAEHFGDPKELFYEEYRLLQDGGVMVSLNIPNKKSIQELNVIMRWFKKIFGLYTEDIRKDYYRNDLSAKEYKKQAEGAGFKNVSIVHVCPFPIFVPIKVSTDKQITKIYRFILFFRRLFQKYPYKTNSILAQAHFLVAYK